MSCGAAEIIATEPRVQCAMRRRHRPARRRCRRRSGEQRRPARSDAAETDTAAVAWGSSRPRPMRRGAHGEYSARRTQCESQVQPFVRHRKAQRFIITCRTQCESKMPPPAW